MIKKRRIIWIQGLEYIILIVLIYSMGTPIGDQYSLKLRLLLLAAAGFLVLCKGRLKVPRRQMSTVVLLAMFIMLTMVLNFDNAYKVYLGTIVILVLCLLIAIAIPRDEFKKMYSDIILVICLISLFFYTISLVHPSIINNLPNFNGLNYKTFFYLYFHGNTTKELGTFTPTIRNAGIFRECGIFQVYINLAIFLELMKGTRIRNFRMIVYWVTLLTTYSSAGILCGIPMLIVYWRQIGKMANGKHKTRFVLLTFFIIILFGLYLYSNYNILFLEKITEDGTSAASMKDRLACLESDLRIFIESPIWGRGFTNLNAEGIGSECSFTCIAALYGIIFPIVLLIGVMRFTRQGHRHDLTSLMGAVSLIIAFSLQNVLMYPGFFIIVMYGLAPVSSNLVAQETIYNTLKGGELLRDRWADFNHNSSV